MSETRFSHAWRALRSPNFQLFFAGQGISVIGTWMTRLATSWLVYRLTSSALLLGIVSFAGQIVSFLLGPFAGVWVERLNRRKLLAWIQAASAVQALVMVALTHWIGAAGYRDADGACCTLVAIWFMFRLPRMNASMQSIYRKTG